MVGVGTERKRQSNSEREERHGERERGREGERREREPRCWMVGVGGYFQGERQAGGATWRLPPLAAASRPILLLQLCLS